MRLLLSLACLLTVITQATSQNIERKIIIKNNSFFYTTIDKEVQIGTLNTGSFSEGMKTAKKLALPAGRNYNIPLNPFSWDLQDSIMYAVSFLNHPLNSKNDALKRFHLSSLAEWNDSIQVMDLIMKSVDQNRFTYNEPYKFMMHRSNYLNEFHYDGIVLHDSSYVMVIANNNELSIWNYQNEKWTHGDVQAFTINGFFTLFEKDAQLYILLNNGNVHNISNRQVTRTPDKMTNRPLTENTLILNRDKNTFQLIKNNELNLNVPLDELISKKGISIF